MKIDGFLMAMISAVLLALAWPTPGAAGGVLHLDRIVQYGVALVFFLQGSMLAPAAMISGIAKWRLHLFIQTTTFLIFPIVGGLFYAMLAGIVTNDLRLGFFFLCAMASTITSSVAMTAMARGDVPSAVFNASASGLIGMIATPLLMQCVGAAGHGMPPLGDAIRSILLTLALPFALGQICRPLTLPFLGSRRKLVSRIDRSMIVLIVYTSFCDSTATGVWHTFGLGQLLMVALLSTALLLTMLSFTAICASALGFDRQERIAAIFCGSKKSLASGAPTAKIMFAGHPGLGIIMLPLLLYHQIQLIVCTILAGRYARGAATGLADRAGPVV
jgi:sodium/bile acid cotransporter 7